MIHISKGQHITSPGGPGEVIETIGDKVVVKLDIGETNTYPSTEVAITPVKQSLNLI